MGQDLLVGMGSVEGLDLLRGRVYFGAESTKGQDQV